MIYNHPNHVEKLKFHNGKMYIFYDQNGKRYYHLNLCNSQQSKEFFKPMSYLKCSTQSLSNNHDHNCMTHIDHANKQSINLVDFMTLYGCRFRFKDIKLDHDKCCYYIANPNVKTDWCNYHKENACLVPVDKTWNLKNNQKAVYFKQPAAP